LSTTHVWALAPPPAVPRDHQHGRQLELSASEVASVSAFHLLLFVFVYCYYCYYYCCCRRVSARGRMLSSAWSFVKRHKRKLVFTGALLGGKLGGVKHAARVPGAARQLIRSGAREIKWVRWEDKSF